MIKYIIKTVITDSVIYLRKDHNGNQYWTTDLYDAIKYDRLEDAEVVSSGPLKHIAAEIDTYELDLSEIISDSLKSL